MRLQHFVPYLAIFLFPSSILAQEDAIFRLVTLDENVGIEVGRGYDILKGNPRADCVDRSQVEGHPNFGLNSVVFNSKRVETSEQLDKALNISVSASAKALSWGASASASFASSISVSTYDLTYVVSATVSAKGDSLRDVKLKDQYVKLISSGKDAPLRRFREICGDGYVGEFVMGGQLQAIIQVHTNSKAESEKIAASLSASYSFVSGSASFSSSLKKVSENNQVRIWSFQRGGGGLIAMTPEDLATKAAALPDVVKASPTPIQAGVFSYITLLEDPDLPFVDFSNRERGLAILGNLARSARDQGANVQYILDHPAEFYSSPTDIPLLAKELQALEDFRKAVAKQADSCVEDSGNCEMTEFPIPAPTVRPARR